MLEESRIPLFATAFGVQLRSRVAFVPACHLVPKNYFSGCVRGFDRHNKNAGWSSLVARQAHNLKVASSNLAPATNFLFGCREFIAFTFCEILMPNFTSAWPRTLIAGSNNITPEDRTGQGHAVHGLAYGKAKNFSSVTRENSKTVLSDKKVDMASIALLVFHGL